MDQAKDVRTLSSEELDGLVRQLNEEVETLRTNIQKMHIAGSSFKSAKINLERISNSVDLETLIPLTDSMYVPGKIVNDGMATVEIGAGYSAVLPIKDALKYIDRKVEFLNNRVAELSPVFDEKSATLSKLVTIVQERQGNSTAAGTTANTNTGVATAVKKPNIAI
ncbi:hypothetical protein GJ496_003014 [Pomphorhynchus laevis]|nr:hypothetical protein GJ496_003014 [Pomphorhynchus laevis]